MTLNESERAPLADENDKPCLSLPLGVLFGLNGVTLALPTTALLYIVNTRVEMPLNYLPTYGALAFLPFCLKPLYAYLSTKRRNGLLSALLLASALSIIATAFVPKGGILACFVVGFLRGLFSAWPEFLLGLTLLDQASSSHANREQTAALFQSQAATARGLGSLLAHALVFCYFGYSRFSQAPVELNDASVTLLLVVSGSLNVVGATIAWYYQVGISPLSMPISQTSSCNSCESGEPGEEEVLVESGPPAFAEEPSSATTTMNVINVRLVVLLQVTIILISLRGPIMDVSSNLSWGLMVAASLIGLVVLSYLASLNMQWKKIHRVGLFLILRHALPTTAVYLLDSYLYTIFQATPAILQLFSLAKTTVTTVASWLYGRILSPYAKDDDLHRLIAITTLLAAVASLGNVLLVDTLPHLDKFGLQVAMTLIIGSITTWTENWNFLPDVVLATVSVVETSNAGSYQTGVEYGTLISCIDFGDQVGALLLGPLVAVLGISRENDWDHLDTLLQLCALTMLLSIGLIGILRDSSRQRCRISEWLGRLGCFR